MHPWDQGVVAIVSSRGEGGRGGGRWSQERGETELRDRKVRSMSARHTVRAFFPAKTLFFVPEHTTAVYQSKTHEWSDAMR